MTLKLYTVVRHDLSLGAQAAQSAHALAALALSYPTEFRGWGNQTIVLLKTDGRTSIESLAESAEDGGFKYATFTEPETGCLGMAYPMPFEKYTTAIAFVPNWLVQNVLLAHLPLAVTPPPVIPLTPRPAVQADPDLVPPTRKGWFS